MDAWWGDEPGALVGCVSCACKSLEDRYKFDPIVLMRGHNKGVTDALSVNQI